MGFILRREILFCNPVPKLLTTIELTKICGDHGVPTAAMVLQL